MLVQQHRDIVDMEASWAVVVVVVGRHMRHGMHPVVVAAHSGQAEVRGQAEVHSSSR
jgi:hypothetical protein